MTIPRLSSCWPLFTIASFLAGCSEGTTPTGTAPPDNMIEAYLDFKLPEISDAWSFRTPGLWHLEEENGNRFLVMKPPPPRDMMPGAWRPQEYALYNRQAFRSFSLSCWLRIDQDPQIAKRDACVIFGRQDDTHLYYVHLSGYSDETHNTIMRVEGDARQSIVPVHRRPDPALTDREWHKVDILRNVDTGLIEVYVDEHTQAVRQPLMRAYDRRYEWGFVGVGSVDDHISLAGLHINGQARDADLASTEVTPRSSP